MLCKKVKFQPINNIVILSKELFINMTFYIDGV